MKLSRRSLVVFLTTVPTLGVLSYNAFFRNKNVVHRTIAASFGKKIASSSPAREFADAYTQAVDEGRKPLSSHQIVRHMVQSTNVIQHVENNEELVFTGLFDPYQTPCANMLSANFEA